MKSSFKRPGAAPTGGAKAPAAPARPAPAKKPGASAPSKPGPKKVAAPIAKQAPSRPPPGVRTNVPVKEAVVDQVLPAEDGEAIAGATTDVEDGQVVVYEPATNMFTAPIGKGIGQFDASDIEMPLLKIAQGSDSPLINDLGFADGDLVLNSEAILYQDGCAPVEFTVLRYQKRFQQQLDYDPGSDVFPKTYDTKEQAAADGLIPFGGHEVGYAAIMDAIVLIKQPEGVEGSTFFEEHDGVNYSQAMWQIRGTAYKAVARKIYTAERIRLKNGIHHGSFKLELIKTKGKIGVYWVPRLSNGEMHTAEFIEFAEAVASGQGGEG